MKVGSMQFSLSIEARGSSTVACPLIDDVYRIGSGSACQIRIATKHEHALTLFRRGPAFFALNRTSQTLRIGSDQFPPNSTMPWAPGRRLQLDGITLRLESAIQEQTVTRMVYSRSLEAEKSESPTASHSAVVPSSTSKGTHARPADRKRRSMLTTIVLCLLTVVAMHWIAGVAAEHHSRHKAELQGIADQLQQLAKPDSSNSPVSRRSLELLNLVSRLQFADALDEPQNLESAKFEIRIFCESLRNSSQCTSAELKIADELIRWMNPSE